MARMLLLLLLAVVEVTASSWWSSLVHQDPGVVTHTSLLQDDDAANMRAEDTSGFASDYGEIEDWNEGTLCNRVNSEGKSNCGCDNGKECKDVGNDRDRRACYLCFNPTAEQDMRAREVLTVNRETNRETTAEHTTTTLLASEEAAATSSMNAAEAYQNELNLIAENTHAAVQEQGDRIPPMIPPIEKAATMESKGATKSQKASEKDAENSMKSFDEKAEKEAESEETKKNEKMVDTNEKAVEKEEKEGDKYANKEASSSEKAIAKDVKAQEKRVEQDDGKSEDAGETATDLFDSGTEHESEMAAATDSTDALLEQVASSQERAFDDKDTMWEGLDDMLERGMDAITSEAANRAGDTSQAMADEIKEVTQSTLATAGQTYDGIDEMAKAGAQGLKEVEKTAKENEKEGSSGVKAMEKIEKKVDKAVEKSTSKQKDGYDKGVSTIATLKASGIDKITGMEDLAVKKIDGSRAELDSDLAKKRDTVIFNIDKGSSQILDDSETAANQVASSFSSGYDAVGASLKKIERDFDSAKNRAYSDEQTTQQAINDVEKVDAKIEPEMQKDLETSTKTSKNIQEQVENDSSEVLDVLSQQVAQVRDLVKNDAESYQQEVQGAHSQLGEEIDSAEERLSQEAHEIQHTFSADMKDVYGSLKPAESAQSTAHQNLLQIAATLATINSDTAAMKTGVQDQLMGVQDRIAQAMEHLTGATQTTFQEDEAYSSERMAQLQQQLSGVLQQHMANFETSASNIAGLIKDATESQNARRQLEGQKTNAVGMQLNQVDAQVKGQEKDSGPEYKEMFAGLTLSNEKIEEIAKLTAAHRNEFSAEMQQKMAARIAQLQTELLAELDKAVKGSSGQTVELGEDLKDLQSQAEAETQGTMKNVDSSISQTAAAYRTILDQVQKLEEREQGTTGAEWMDRAKKAIALMQQDAIKQSEAQATVDAEYAKGEGTANEDLRTFQGDQQKERAEFTARLLKSIDAIELMRKDDKEQVDQKVGEMDSSARVTWGKISAEQARMQEELSDASNAVGGARDQGLNNLKNMERQVDDRSRQEFAALDQMSLDAARTRAAEQAEQANVKRDMEAEGRAVQGEVGSMQNAVGRMMAKLDPTASLSVVTNSINSIEGLMAHAQETEQAMVGKVENDVKITSKKIEKILAEANLEGGMLSKAVMATSMEVRDALSTLKTQLAAEQQSVRGLAKDTLATSEDLASAQKRRVDALQTKMEGTRARLEKALGLQKYQSGEALEKVQMVLDKAVDIDGGLRTEKDEVIVPSTQTWRGQVERVFEGLGLALDLERVERMAAASLAAEEAQGGGMMTAKEKMDSEIAMIQKRMQNEIDWVRAKAEKEIAAIMAMEHLSDEEKAARIAAIRRQCDKDVYALVMKTKKLISDQYMSGHKLDEEINDLNALLERAKLIAGQGTAESAKWAKAMMGEVKKRLDRLRDRFVNNFSLVQIQQLVDNADKAVEAAAGPFGSHLHPTSKAMAPAAFLKANNELGSFVRSKAQLLIADVAAGSLPAAAKAAKIAKIRRKASEDVAALAAKTKKLLAKRRTGAASPATAV